MNSRQLFCCIALLAVAAPVAAQMTPTRRTTADGRPLASSLPPKGAARGGATTLSFEDLSRHVGDKVIVTTVYGVHREGHVDAVQGQTLRLRVSAGLGYAVVNVERDKIREIRDLE